MDVAAGERHGAQPTLRPGPVSWNLGTKSIYIVHLLASSRFVCEADFA
jgi:hypothetical protein